MVIISRTHTVLRLATQVKHGVGVQEIVDHVLRAWEIATGNRRR